MGSNFCLKSVRAFGRDDIPLSRHRPRETIAKLLHGCVAHALTG